MSERFSIIFNDENSELRIIGKPEFLSISECSHFVEPAMSHVKSGKSLIINISMTHHMSSGMITALSRLVIACRKNESSCTIVFSKDNEWQKMKAHDFRRLYKNVAFEEV